MKLIIDRFEGDFAVCEVQAEKRMISLRRAELPAGAQEGSVLLVTDNVIALDQDETNQRKEKIKKLMDSLWE